MEADGASVALADPFDLRPALMTGSHGARARGNVVDDGMVAHVLATGEPLTVDDYRELFWPRMPDIELVPQAGGSTPIRWGGRLRGVLSVCTSDPVRAFGPRELEMLGDVADLGSLALQSLERNDRLETALRGGIELLAAAVDMRDSSTARHSEHVVGLARMVGEALGLDAEGVRELEFAAQLHDVGKIGVPDFVLRKPGALNAEEWMVMRRHPVSGAEMLRRVPGLEGVAAIVRHHHEHFDGSGYPFGLRGDEIPVASRIISACDAYDAMISDRPYRSALGHALALRELRNCAGTQFDPEVVEGLIEVVPQWAEQSIAV